MYSDKNYGLSKSLIQAVKEAVKSHTVPKTEKEKDLAALAEPKDKITHKDVMVGRGVMKKEEVEPVAEMSYSAKSARAGKDIGKKGKMFSKIAASAAKKYGSAEAGARVAGSVLKKLRMKEDADFDLPDNFIDFLVEAEKEEEEEEEKEEEKKGKKASKKEKEKEEKEEEEEEEKKEMKEAAMPGVAAGSMEGDKHLCATKVFHKEWKEGSTLFSQHAQPDAEGNIAWYDVMFEHGIEKRVPITDLEVTVAESHMNHKKGKK